MAAQKTLKTAFLKNLCYFKVCKKNDREMRLKDKAFDDFEGHLDIRNFVGAQKKFALMLWLFLTKE